jgi:thiazole synthase ThiGH ThiG subunit
MAKAFANAVDAGRTAYLVGSSVKGVFASPTSPLTGFLD